MWCRRWWSVARTAPPAGPGAVFVPEESHEARPAGVSVGRAAVRALPRLREAALVAPPHAARLLGRARLGVLVLHPVAASPRGRPARADLRHHRSHRVRARRARGLRLARLRRPGPADPLAQVVASPARLRGRAVRPLVRARTVLAAPDPRTHGSHRIQRARHRRLPVRGRPRLLAPAAGRAGAAAPVPLGRPPARALDRPASGAGRRLAAGGGAGLVRVQRSAAGRLRERGQRGVLGPRHADA